MSERSRTLRWSLPATALALMAIVIVGGMPTKASEGTATFGHMASYMADGERIQLEPEMTRFSLGPNEGVDAAILAVELAESLGSTAEVTLLPVDIIEVRVNGASARPTMRELRRDPRVSWAEPVFMYGDMPEYMTGHFLVAFDEATGLTDFAGLHDAAGAFLHDEIESMRYPLFEMRLEADRDFDVLDIVEMYQSTPGIRYAEPVFYFPGAQYTPNDQFYPDQWPLNNTGGNPGTPGADIDADLAWDIERGNPSVIIAIHDEGVDMDHPDLVANIVGGVDTTDQAPPGGVPGNPDCGDGHGTSCAGIAAGKQDNNIGVSGVCPNCSLAGVRMARGSVWTTNTWIVNAFNWSRDNNVAVSSNSWGGGSPSSSVTNSINDLFENGRNGLGCVVLASSGNGDNGSVIYPASLSNVVAVGASSPCDERKSVSSCDGETWWGSNYGSALDVVAPGVLYYSTDIGGGCGYSNGDYVSNFNGTSSACPNAAGVVGLILSRNPNLTSQEARDVLEDSCDDQVGPANEDPPGRDNWMGHGRVNANTAVLSVGPLEPPTLTNLTPTAGSVAGNTSVTITGTNFSFDTDVTFGGVPATNVIYIDEDTVIAQTPSGAALDAVDVEVSTSLGSDSVSDGFSYYPTLASVGTPSPGSTIFLQGFGVASSDWGVVKDLVLGPRFKKGILWQIRFSGNFEIIKNSFAGGDNPLTGSGQGQAQYQIPDDPGLIGEDIYFEGVFDGNGPGGGRDLTLADLVTVTVVPNP